MLLSVDGLVLGSYAVWKMCVFTFRWNVLPPA